MPNQKEKFIEQFLGKSQTSTEDKIKPPTFFDKQVGEYIRSHRKKYIIFGSRFK